jgi:hypothetical protein
VRTDEPFENDPIERALDELLKRARFPQPSVQSEQRLRDTWIALSRKRQVRWVVSLVSAAAVLALVAGSILLWNRRNTDVLVPNYAMILRDAPTPARSRDANLWERALVQRPFRGTSTQPSVVQVKAPQQMDVESILRRISNPATRGETIESLRQMSNPPVNELFAELRSPLMEKRFAAARALGALPGPRIVPALQQMLARGEARREALAALMFCDDPAAQQVLLTARQSRSIDAQCIALGSQINPGL